MLPKQLTRIAVIGAGAWGINHVRVIAADPRCELVTVADPDPEARQRVHAIAPQARTTNDADDVIADCDVDAVVVASPAPTHAAIGRAVLRAGKHLLVEKPVALTLSDATALALEGKSMGCVGMIGHLMLYHPAVVRLRELLQSGALGTLHYLHSSRVNLGRLRSDESALWSFGPHDLSMIDFLLGRSPRSVVARGQCVLQEGVEDVAFLTLRYDGGELAHIQVSWLSPRKERRLTLVCSHKMAEFDDVGADKLRIYDKGYDRPPRFAEYGEYLTVRDGAVYIPQIVMQEPLRVQLQHFLDCIATGQHPVSDLSSGVRILRVLDAAQRSLARDGQPVELAPDHG